MPPQVWPGAQPGGSWLLPSWLPTPHLSYLAQQISQLQRTKSETWRYNVQDTIAQTQLHKRHRRQGILGYKGVGGFRCVVTALHVLDCASKPERPKQLLLHMLRRPFFAPPMGVFP